ncbi:hypothetical protein KL918_001571 [Ogataea parapolymorpha]|nr:hypothetical protein KL918_001571 [Ogataea parapolymorpha]KAG7874009.1 hypothetical protein KL916_001783 [Ogataea parapolymorpha]
MRNRQITAQCSASRAGTRLCCLSTRNYESLQQLRPNENREFRVPGPQNPGVKRNFFNPSSAQSCVWCCIALYLKQQSSSTTLLFDRVRKEPMRDTEFSRGTYASIVASHNPDLFDK